MMAKANTKGEKPLKAWFNEIIAQSPINIDSPQVNDMLKRNFNINPEELDARVLKILPEMIGHYISSWPGWNKYKDYGSGKISLQDWFKKFKTYMKIRVNNFITKGFNEAVEKLRAEEYEQKTWMDRGPQTDNLAAKGFSPYSLDITCSSKLINTLVFASNDTNDVIIQHHDSIPWSSLTFKSLINWPYVSISFQTEEFSFTRSVNVEYERYISLLNTTHQLVKSDFISDISIIDKNVERKCFSYKYFEEFIMQYKNVLTKVSEDILPKDNYDDICSLLNNFFLDIEEINIKNSMATNTSVTFNIGNSVYTRNKKIKASPETSSDVAYVEIITPRIQLKLNRFNVIQDEKDTKISFQHLNQLADLIETNSAVLQNKMPVLMFHCAFCKMNFKKKFNLIEHLYLCHQMEQCVLCSDCKIAYKVEQLTSVRWSHACKMNKTKKHN